MFARGAAELSTLVHEATDGGGAKPQVGGGTIPGLTRQPHELRRASSLPVLSSRAV